MVRAGWANASDSRYQLIRPPEPIHLSVRGNAEGAQQLASQFAYNYMLKIVTPPLRRLHI